MIKDFEKETGIKVKYLNYTTNEEMYMKMTSGGGVYDVIFPSDYMIERLIAEDALMELDYSKIPNANGMLDWLKDTDYDAGSRHSVPYMWGTVGILYNEEYVDEPITSWKSLFDPKYQDDVFMLKSVRDTIGVTLKMLGYSVNENSEKALNEVRDVLIKQKQDGIVQGYMVDEVKEKMISGEAAMAVMWSATPCTRSWATIPSSTSCRRRAPTCGSTACASPRTPRTPTRRISSSTSSAAPTSPTATSSASTTPPPSPPCRI